MKQFKDNIERTWTLSLNIATAKRVKDVLNFDLLSDEIGEMVGRLSTDPVLLCDVIFVLVMEEAETRSVTDVNFGEAMAGDAIENATQALLEEIVEFFPPKKRHVLRIALDRMAEAEVLLLDRAEKAILGRTTESIVEEIIRKESEDGNSSLKLPEQSESIPTR